MAIAKFPVRSLGIETFSGTFDKTVHGVAFPHSRVTVLMELGSGSSSVNGMGLRAMVVGLRSKPTSFAQTGLIDCVELRMPPSAAYRLGFGLSEIADSVVPVDRVFGRRVESLRDQLAAMRPVERAGFLRTLVCDQLDRARPSQAEKVLEALEHGDARMGVGVLAAIVGSSRSTVWRQVSVQLGMSPQRFVSLQRFERGAELLAQRVPIGRAAVEAGYVDQSHFHRYVRRFAGMTPRELASLTAATSVQDYDTVGRAGCNDVEL